MSGSSLVVPIVLWGRSAPTHCVSSILLTTDQRTIATGSLDGQIILWDLSDQLEVIPRNMLIGHSAAITCLTKVDAWDKNNLVSAAENGELCLWDLTDGRCVEFTKISGIHVGMVTYNFGKMALHHEPRILLYGYYPEIHVVNASNLEMLFSLSSKVSPDWISCLTMFRPMKRQEDVVIALSRSGVLKVWALTGNESKESEPIYEDESKQLRCFNSETLTCSAFTQRTVLIVCSKFWHVYDAGDFSLLCSVSHHKGERWSGGDFLQANRVIVWTREGTGYLYKLPPNCDPDCDEFRSGIGKPVRQKHQPHLYCVLEANVKKPLECAPAMTFVYGRRGQFYKLLLRGDCNGTIMVWNIPNVADKEISHLLQVQFDTKPLLLPEVTLSLQEVWDEQSPKPAGIIDQLSIKTSKPTEELIAVSCSVYLPDHGRLVCGRTDGSIVIVPATQTCCVQILNGHNAKRSGWPPHRILRGHHGKVMCLLYPHQDSPRYEAHLLLSGGVDFSVILWDLFTGTMIHQFVVHGGEITQILVPPDTCNTRICQCVCTVASDHSVALLSVKEKKCVMLAGSHLFPINVIKWRPLDDFLVVGCVDHTVYVWQMETGHLDRVVQGNVAEDILSACHETITPYEGNRSLRHHLTEALKRHSLSALKSLAQRHLTSNTNTAPSQVLPNSSDAMNIQQLRCNSKDSDIHVLFFDVEALIIQLLTDERLNNPVTLDDSQTDLSSMVQARKAEAARRVTTSTPGLSERVQYFVSKQIDNMAQILDNSDDDDNRYLEESDLQKRPQDLEFCNRKDKNLTLLDCDLTLDIAQLLMSCLHAWGSDLELDDVCVKKLGLLKPYSSVSFGQLSRGGYMSLMLPGWHRILGRTMSEVRTPGPGGVLLVSGESSLLDRKESNSLTDDGDPVKNVIIHSAHWQLSSAVTTQHLLAVIAIANTLMSMNNASFLTDKEKNNRIRSQILDSRQVQVSNDTSDDSDKHLISIQAVQAQMKQGWSLLAALHCVLLPDLLGPGLFKAPEFEELARRWQDRCLEVREAAQALLLAELKRIGPPGRKKVVEQWSPFIPSYVDQNTLRESPSTTSLKSISESAGLLQLPLGDSREEDLDTECMEDDIISGSTGLPQRFAGSFELRRKQAMAIVMLGVIGAEFGQEFQPRVDKIPQSTHNIPEGFGLSNYSLSRQTSQALTFLLLQPASQKLPAHTPIRRAAIELIGRGFTVWEPFLDVSAVLLGLLELCFDSDKLLASKSPGLPLSPACDSCRTAHHALSLIATARPPTFIATMAKEVARYTALIANAPSQAAILANSVLFSAKAEILRIIDILIEKMFSDVVELLVEVMDIVIHCLDITQVKTRGLLDTFPPICKFSQVTYCMRTRRIAVGARNGNIAMYDLRTTKSQIIHAHQPNSISALSFSPDGNNLVSVSLTDAKLHFWNTGSTLFGMLSSNVKCARTFSLRPVEGYNTRILRLEWSPVSNKMVTLKFTNSTEQKFNV